MQIEWDVVKRGDISTSNARIYVTMNRNGEIVLNGTAYKRLGAPAAFMVMYNRPNSLIALKPTVISMKNAFPARKHGRRDGRIIRALRLLIDHNINLPDTVEFRDAEIDSDGILILDLRTARVSPRAHSQCRKG